MDVYCAEFKLKGTSPRGKEVVFSGYSEHVWIVGEADKEDWVTDMLHFAADSLNMSIGEICQIVADLGGSIDYVASCVVADGTQRYGWLDAYVPLSCVQSIAFVHG